ncbi:P-loop containing nucleoside triphosphate hydrolase protein [Gymnopilus junonius]|uniref:P-loop containing nucleoside triphosphate hydrolase protein n=1 Tax=Gymnopilus junonius TaxID=109634 RepID=A0A9P5NIY8_GYMJU|nr:P-loop containing nucleoside triphosphate hydrolase protein [Gymnopilus junonius]
MNARPSASPHEEADVFLPFNRKNVSVPEVISLGEVIPYFEGNVHSWAKAARTKDRLQAFGVPLKDATRLLDAFVDDVEDGLLSDPEHITYYGLQRFTHPQDATSIDIIYSTVFFWWAAHPENEIILEEEFLIDRKTVQYIQRLVKATSRQYPADEWPEARAMHRKFIMHVGPTNSGKTHHALRALAAAKSGLFAGPLRLLAHEIWHRLNTGQIVPLGVEEDPKAPRSAEGNPEYARLCDMITGEEQRIMGPDSPLQSCTVEMVPYMFRKYDVAVIDEIQMISDWNRGGGWVSAVLGLCAHEIHLCGEESAVPVVEALLKHTGDELEVRRYERLTPLVVEEQSLNGDLTKIRKGDCVVTFSRSKIFELKKLVEAQTGLRCAVVYGRLPPEVRSDQAALFNDPNSGYDVLIGSDSIGMGLNLRIKRIIFETMHKFGKDGRHLLSISTVKQISGRAGRYGVHEDQADLGGTVTTLYPEDLPHVSRWITSPYEPLPYVIVQNTPEILHACLSILPAGSSMNLALLAPKYIGRIPPFVRYAAHEDLGSIASVLGNEWAEMSVDDKLVLLYAPIPWKDQKALDCITKMLAFHAQDFAVAVMPCITQQDFLQKLEKAEDSMVRGAGSKAKLGTLMNLESFHKALVFYIWMRCKNPIVYSDESVHELKARVEKVLNWTLTHMSTGKKNPARKFMSPLSAERLQANLKLKDNLVDEEEDLAEGMEEDDDGVPYPPMRTKVDLLSVAP